MPLTELEIKNFKPKDKVYRKTDSEGLRIDVMPSGSKLWRWRYYFNGKPQMLALGKYPAVSLKKPTSIPSPKAKYRLSETFFFDTRFP